MVAEVYKAHLGEQYWQVEMTRARWALGSMGACFANSEGGAIHVARSCQVVAINA